MEQGRTLKVAVTLSVEVDLAEYRESYGDEDVATIRESVKYAAADGIRAVLTAGIADVTIR